MSLTGSTVFDLRVWSTTIDMGCWPRNPDSRIVYLAVVSFRPSSAIYQ